MSAHKQILFLFILIILLLPWPACSAPASPGARVASAEYLAQAKSLFYSGKTDEAWKMLTRLVRENPEDFEVNSFMAEAAFATGRFNQGIGALERMVNLYPQNAKLHMALAGAYARAGDVDNAEAEKEMAESLQPGITSEAQMADLENAAKSEQRQHDRFKAAGRLAMGIVWDSNPTGGLDSLDVGIGNWNFRLDEDAGKKPSWGEYINGSINWGVQASGDAPWFIAGDVAFYGKKYDRDLPSNNTFKWGRAAVGPRYIGQKSMLDIRFKTEEAILDPKDRLDATGWDMSWVYAFLPSVQFIARGGIDYRTYWDRDERDGTYWNGGAYLRYIFAGDYSIMAGGRLLGSQAETERWSYDGWEISGKLDMTFFKRLDVSPYISWREYNYHSPATLLSEILGEQNRRDNALSAGVSAVWHWNDHLATELGWEYVKNHSSSQFYRYNQHQFNMGMVVSF